MIEQNLSNNFLHNLFISPNPPIYILSIEPENNFGLDPDPHQKSKQKYNNHDKT